MHRYNTIEGLEDEGMRKYIDDLSPGCFVVAIQLPCGNTEFITMHKCNNALSMMVPRENLFSLHLRYLNA
jgi:hypothetical protein